MILLTGNGERRGHDGVLGLHRILREHIPHCYEFPVKLVSGRFAFIEWRAREPGRSVEDGADSFVIERGKIVRQTIHYTLMETMPD